MQINKNDLIALFLTIPEIEQAGLLDIQELKTGLTNQSYKLNTQTDGDWVIRFNGKDILGVDREAEQEILGLIKPLNIGPQIISNKLQQGYLISRFIEGSVWTLKDCQNPKLQNSLFGLMEQLHQITYNNPKTALKHRLELYLSKSPLIHNYSFMQEYKSCMLELDNTGFWQQQNRLIHYDLNPGNIIGHKNPKIIDWEFAGMGNPDFDRGIFNYYAEKPAKTSDKQVHKLVQLMMQLWASINQ